MPTNSPTTTRWSPPAVRRSTDDRRLTYAQLRAEVRQAAAAMIDLGVAGRGSRRDLVAQHLALGGGVPGHPLRRRRHRAAEHPLHRQRGQRHPRPAPAHRCCSPRASSSAPTRPHPWTVTPCPTCGTSCASRSRRTTAPGTSSSPAATDLDAGRRPRRRRAARRRLRHPVHLRHHRPQQGRAVRTPPVTRRPRGVGGLRRAHQRRPLPVHQPVLPQLRLQGGHPGLPADRRDADPAADVRPREGDGRRGRAPHHRAARAADDLPDAAGPSQARRLRPDLAAVRGHRRGRRSRWC